MTSLSKMILETLRANTRRIRFLKLLWRLEIVILMTVVFYQLRASWRTNVIVSRGDVFSSSARTDNRTKPRQKDYFERSPSQLSDEIIPAPLSSNYPLNGTIVMTFVDSGQSSMAVNLYLTSFKKFNITNHVFIASDHLVCDKLNTFGARCLRCEMTKTAAGTSFNVSLGYNTSSCLKARILLDTLRIGLDVLLVDLDVVFFEDPLPFVAQYRGYDLIGQAGLAVNAINSGFVFVRNTSRGVELLESVLQMTSTTKHPDQDSFNKALNTFRHRIKLQILPTKYFQTGNIFYGRSRRLFAWQNRYKPCILLHDNSVDPLEEKIYRFKEYGLWQVDDGGYYSDVNRKYIAYENPVDFSVYGRKGNDVTRSVELEAIKTALIIGRLLNRTVIIPKFHCYNANNGHGSLQRQWCHFGSHFDVKVFDAHLPPLETYRENIFLQHPLVPDRIKGSVSERYLIDGPVWHRTKNGISSRPYGVQLLKPRRKHLSSTEIRNWFSTESASVLYFYCLYNEFAKNDKEISGFLRLINRAVKYAVSFQRWHRS